MKKNAEEQQWHSGSTAVARLVCFVLHQNTVLEKNDSQLQTQAHTEKKSITVKMLLVNSTKPNVYFFIFTVDVCISSAI